MDIRKALRTLEAEPALLDLTWTPSETALEERDVQECRNKLSLSNEKFSEILELIQDIPEGKIIAGKI